MYETGSDEEFDFFNKYLKRALPRMGRRSEYDSDEFDLDQSDDNDDDQSSIVYLKRLASYRDRKGSRALPRLYTCFILIIIFRMK